MKLFGGWLPFIGFRTLSDADVVAMDLDPQLDYPELRWLSFEIEWFNRGIVLFVNPVAKKE